MKNLFQKTLFLSSLLFAIACGDGEAKNADDRMQTQDISHNGSIESVMTTQHLADSRDVLITSHRVWKSGQIVSEIIHRDTIPSLEVGTVEAADANGNATKTAAQKDYEFYITVK